MAEIFVETDDDYWEVEALFDLCFAPTRTMLSSYRLREGVPAVRDLCFVVKENGAVTTAIRFWPVQMKGQLSLLLGPIAVHPTHQGEGLGGYLITHSLETARQRGWERALLVGDLKYYSRFGFAVNDNITMPPPTDPMRVLTLALTPKAWDSLSGTVTRADHAAQRPGS